MKKLFLSSVAVMIATVNFAQTSLLATLSHEGSVKTYYGASALKSAYADATHGDVITLSSGSFYGTNIEKAITIRGAGMDYDSLSLREPTIILGPFEINIADSVPEKLTIEGIYHNHKITYQSVSQPMFLKCRLYEIDSRDGDSYLKNASFIHSYISSKVYLCGGYSSASFLSCVVSNPSNYQANTAYEFSNCVIITKDFFNLFSAAIKNSFLRCNTSTSSERYYTLHPSCDMINNVGINSTGYQNGKIFTNSPNSTNKTVSSISEVFKTWTGTWDDGEKYELADETKTKYLGTDGTQIGIYGGNLPFESTPSNPQITKCQVASKSTADGKLSVDITIRASE